MTKDMTQPSTSESSLFKEGVPILEERYRLFVSPDSMEAYLVKSGSGPALVPEDIPQLFLELKARGVVYGLLDEPEEGRGGRLVVARGKPPLPGKDARIELLVDLSRGPLKEEKPDRVVYRELNTLVCVEPGQPVARRLPPGLGEPGMDVFGTPVPPLPGRDISFNYGSGLEADELLLRAKTAGVLIFENESLSVSPVYVLDSDVDWSVGNIHFCGERLVINGDIKRGFSLKVKGDLEINGSVEDNVQIEVSGDLFIRGLIQGESVLIRCEGDATIGALEYAQIEVSGNLTVLDYLLQPYCLVGKNFRLLDGLGVVLGGKCLIGGSAEVYILGNEAHVRADFRVGYDPLILGRLAELKERQKTMERQERDLRGGLEKGLRLLKKGGLSPAQKGILKKIRHLLENLRDDLRQLILEEKLAREELKRLRKNTLRIEKRIFPGVHVGIADADFSIVTGLAGGTFFLSEKGLEFRATKGE